MAKDLSIYGDVTNYPCSLVMSGVESDAYFDIAIGEEVDRMLMSYHYIQRKGKNFLRDRLSKHPQVKMMIDSGAHTFIAKEEEYIHKPIEFWEDYIERYVRFIRNNKEFIFSCVELDIAHLVGFEKVDYFRTKYFEPLKNEGILVCYVWHEYDGIKHWEEMCEKYDYVGFSLGNNVFTEAQINRMINTARKHGALVHGFAVTRTELMSKIPFFTGDSTTWLVGTQYGELNWFDGRKMKRLKKDKWKFEYKQKYINIGAKWELAGEENPYELIRINLIVFKLAEDYIRKRIRGKSYWLENKLGTGTPVQSVSLRRKVIKRKESISEETVSETENKVAEAKKEETSMDKPTSKFEEFQTASKVELRELESQLNFIPDYEWFDGECEDYNAYIKELGIDVNGNSKDLITDFLFNCYIFLVEPNLLDDVPEEDILSVSEIYLKKKFEDLEEAIIATTEFLTRNLTLEEKTAFPRPSVISHEATERPKEREDYLEDEEYVTVDVPEGELIRMLPPPKDGELMPEVDEIDRELQKSGIVAVRDEKGRFLKGQKQVRKPKNIYSDKFPKLACNTCYKAGDCPEYRPDHVCAYDKIFKKFDVRNEGDVMDAMSSMVNLNLGRMQRQAMFETMDGGMADGVVTSMIDQNINLLLKMKQLQDMQRTPIATQHRVINSDGSMQETTTVTNPSGGILSQIFGNNNDSADNDDELEKPRKEILEAEVLEDNGD